MIKLLVGTPAYNSMVHTDYLHSILSYTKIKDILCSVLTIGNESLITRARNKIFSYFVKSDYDYLLFLDADVGFSAQYLCRLLSYKKDLIGAPVRLKDPKRVVFNYGKVLDDSENPLLKVDRIGCAVMLISKKLSLDISENCSCKFTNNIFFSRGDKILDEKDTIYDVFKVGVINGEYLSEDYHFCKLARDLNYDVYVDISCKSIHNSMIPLL